MIQDQCISVTDLRTKTKQCLDGLGKEPKYIFINNKPIAVLININKYEELMNPELIELEEKEIDENLKKEAASAKKISKEELLDIQ